MYIRTQQYCSIQIQKWLKLTCHMNTGEKTVLAEYSYCSMPIINSPA